MDRTLPFLLTPTDLARVDGYRAEHQVSLLTILFSDIVDYTRLCEEVPELTMMTIRAEFDALSADWMETPHPGLLVKRIGDAFLAVFAEPSTAVLAAVGLHRALVGRQFEGISLRLRTGIHLGQVAVTRSHTQIDVFGRHVNRASRVQSSAAPGEILVTDAVEDNVRGWSKAASGIDLRFLGRRTLILKGLEDPVTVFTAVTGGEKRNSGESETRDPLVFIELCALEGPSAGTTFQFDAAYNRRVIVGRDRSCAINLPDPSISRQHSMIWSDNEGFWSVVDLGSGGGTQCNGLRVADTQRLNHGDRLQFGLCPTILEIVRLRCRGQAS